MEVFRTRLLNYKLNLKARALLDYTSKWLNAQLTDEEFGLYVADIFLERSDDGTCVKFNVPHACRIIGKFEEEVWVKLEDGKFHINSAPCIACPFHKLTSYQERVEEIKSPNYKCWIHDPNIRYYN